MVLPTWVAVNLFVGLALFILAAAILLAGRPRSEHVLLAVFLALVGANFGFGAVGMVREAYMAFALDPLYLLLFVTTYPYARRTPAVRGLLVAVGAMAAVSLLLAVARPEEIAPARAPGHAFVIAELALAYGAAWVLSVRAAREAPTPLLGRRAAGVVAAVGVAIVPRLGMLADDFGATAGMDYQESIVVGVTLFALLSTAAFAAGLREAGPSGPKLRSAFRLVAAVVVFLTAARALIEVASPFVPGLRLALFYGLRWLLFGGLLLHGVLAFQLVEFRRAASRVLPAVGAAVLGVGAALGALVLTPGPLDAGSGALAALAALAAAGPGALLVRMGVGRVVPEAATADVEGRRLALYQAALEAAWTRGPPGGDARAQLERDRRAFGVSLEEARALEHAVAAQLGPRGPRLATGAEPAPGLVVERLLGEGAHGRVFLARRHPSRQLVVVKELHPAEETSATRQRLLQEVAALRSLDHPGIARLLDVHVSEGRYMLVMEHVDGAPLADLLARGPLGETRTRGLAADLLDALEGAHARGVVHRDIKPSNILVGRDGRARLTDFGVAQTDAMPAATASDLGALERAQGTLGYMAPEQVRGQRASPASDLYSVGLVLLECLAGRPARDLRGASLYAAVERVGAGDVELDGVPKAWQPLLARALERDPARRWPSAHAMRQAILDLRG